MSYDNVIRCWFLAWTVGILLVGWAGFEKSYE